MLGEDEFELAKLRERVRDSTVELNFCCNDSLALDTIDRIDVPLVALPASYF